MINRIQSIFSFKYILTYILIFNFHSLRAREIIKTPTDIFIEALTLKENVMRLKKEKGQTFKSRKIENEGGHKNLGHIFQKSIQVLGKINQIRINKKMGSIPIPLFPTREITSYDVFYLVSRLNREVQILQKDHKRKKVKKNVVKVKTSENIYNLLNSIAGTLDGILGVRNFTPGDVFAQSEKVVALIKFLRSGQNLNIKEIKKPKRTIGKHPNHALASTYDLLRQIREVQKNLWIKPTSSLVVPKRVITPGDVYSGLQTVITELQSVKYRLGVNRSFSVPERISTKTPDDVVQNIEFAKLLLPTFSLIRPLIQYSRKNLLKNSEDTLLIAYGIIERLQLYRQKKGLKIVVGEKSVKEEKVFSRDIYQKILSNIRKVSLLRKNFNLSEVTIPMYPKRQVSTTRTHELMLYLQAELDSVLIQTGGLEKDDVVEIDRRISRRISSDISKKDIYDASINISSIIESILEGRMGIDDVYDQALRVSLGVERLLAGLGVKKNIKKRNLAQSKNLTKKDVKEELEKIANLLQRVKKRSGIQLRKGYESTSNKKMTFIELYNELSSLSDEVSEVKSFLGVETNEVYSREKKEDIKTSDVAILVRNSRWLLEKLLNENSENKKLVTYEN